MQSSAFGVHVGVAVGNTAVTCLGLNQVKQDEKPKRLCSNVLVPVMNLQSVVKLLATKK